MATSNATPSHRWNPFIASAGDLAYLWGGKGDTEPGAVFIYSKKTKTWTKKLTNGRHPPAGLRDGACCIADQHFYLYGGSDGSSRHGTLFQLNMVDWSWKELSNCSPGGPGKKDGCRMVAYKNNLVVIGGYCDKRPGSRQAGSSYDGFRTNEVHSYSLATHQWSSPSINGAGPPPCNGFSLTMIDEDQAVMFGGGTSFGRSSEARVLHLPTMTWRRIQHKDGDPWPEARFYHIAACLGYGGQHKTVLINGGYGVGCTLDDLWLLDVESGRCEEVRVENKKLWERWAHGAAAFSVSSEYVEVILFGGFTKAGSRMEDTTILGFELRPLSGWVSAKRKWFCTCYESADELVKMKQRVTRVVVSDSEASQSFQPVEEPHTTNTASDTTRDTDHEEAEDLSADVLEVSATTSSELPTKNTSSEENTQSEGKSGAVGGDEESFVSDVVQAVDQNQQIERKMANIILKGLPEAGKSSLLNRLLNKPFQEHSSSTGLSEGIVVVDIQPTSTLTSAITSGNSSWEVIDFDTSMYSQLDRFKQFLPSVEEESIEEGASNTTLTYQVYSVSSISEVPGNIEKILSAHNIKNIEDLKKKNSLYIRDTGGQVEFQESLTLLIHGPSIFLFVLRTDVDLLKKTIIRYRLPSGDIINEYKSSISSKDALVQFLTSACAIDTTEEGVFQKGGVYEAHEPVVFIVGTHIDQLGVRADSVIAEMNKSLDEIICQHNFSSVVRYANDTSKRVMYTVDNTSEKDPNIRFLRTDVNTYISNRNEFTVKYPVSYLLLCLELQRIKVSVLKMDKFEHLASKFGISSSVKINHLLHFLHFRIGIIQHYDVDHLSEIVIKEPQVLFNKVTDLLVKTFLSAGALKRNQRASFCEKGILEVSVLENLMDKSKDTITTEQFLAFLVHLRLAVPFTDRNGILKYFIPSVLNHVQSSVCEERKTDIAPLAICFQLGHCPQGLFGVLISHLVSSEEIHSNISFDLSDDKIYQDQVTLLVNSCEDVDEISLKKHLSHIEVTMFLDSASSDVESESVLACRKVTPNTVCTAVRSILEYCLLLSLKTLHYNSKTLQPMLCLACPKENCSAMHEVKQGEEHCYMRCDFSKAKCVIPRAGRYWFSEAPGVVDTGAMETLEPSSKENSKDRETSDARDTAVAKLTDSDDASKNSLRLSQHATSLKSVVEFNLHHLTVLTWTDSDGQRHSLRLRNEMSSRWRDVGDLLEVEFNRQEGIHMHRGGDVRLCCRDVLEDWLQMEEPSYPCNWEGLLLLFKDLKLNKMAKKLKIALDFI